MAYSLNWDLDPIYPGGITSPEFAAKLTLLDEQIKQFAADVTAYDRFTDTDFSQFIALVDAAQTILCIAHIKLRCHNLTWLIRHL